MTLLPLRALRNRRAKRHIRCAHTSLASGDIAAAIASCREAVGLRPDKGRYHVELGHALTRRGAYLYHPQLCQQLLASGELDEAIASWRQALARNTSSWHLHLCLGHALTASGDIQAASLHLSQATDLHLLETKPQHVAQHGNSGTRRGPDFVVIGATKCGTTSLYEYLQHHPQVLPAAWKEIAYYRYPERGHDWYLSHFPRMPDGNTRFLTGEASTCYIGMPSVKHLLQRDFPNARLIAMLRDPVDKAISHFHHDRKLGVETRSLEEALTSELDLLESTEDPWSDPRGYWNTERGYVWHGMYACFVADWLSVFAKEQLLVVKSEDLYEQPAETLVQVYRHLDLPNHPMETYEVHLKGSYERKRDALHERLARFFAPHNARLEEMLGKRLGWTGPGK